MTHAITPKSSIWSSPADAYSQVVAHVHPRPRRSYPHHPLPARMIPRLFFASLEVAPAPAYVYLHAPVLHYPQASCSHAGRVAPSCSHFHSPFAPPAAVPPHLHLRTQHPVAQMFLRVLGCCSDSCCRLRFESVRGEWIWIRGLWFGRWIVEDGLLWRGFWLRVLLIRFGGRRGCVFC
jgi:hypothetical protein